MGKRARASWVGVLLCVTASGAVNAQSVVPADRDRCEELRAQATTLHQERTEASDAEDLVALAIALETFDVALEDIAREYADLRCGRSSGN